MKSLIAWTMIAMIAGAFGCRRREPVVVGQTDHNHYDADTRCVEPKNFVDPHNGEKFLLCKYVMDNRGSFDSAVTARFCWASRSGGYGSVTFSVPCGEFDKAVKIIGTTQTGAR